MRPELLGLAANLAASGEPFVLAVVVRREPASSAQLGNTAVITASGEFHGWLGGSCIRPTVVRESRAALAEGRPRLVSLSPDPSADRRPGVTVFPMTCHSGGSVDIYIEPVLPAPRLVVFGTTPVAQALARLGKGMGLSVDAVVPEADASIVPGVDRVLRAAMPGDHPAEAECHDSNAGSSSRPRVAVVATHGERDEEALVEAIRLEPEYLGLVASRKRFAQVRETLLAGGVPAEALARVRSPAGLDIGAKTPEEVALSILAEVVQVRRARATANPAEAEFHDRPEFHASGGAAQGVDPVCGMTVAIATAKHQAEHGGRTFYFCCAGCRQRFLAEPERYQAAAAR
jgi:xanthine dehydrogenase accessory factor